MMAKLLLFDFKCNKCGYEFEKLIDSEVRVAPCPHCEGQSYRLTPAPRLDYRMGVDPDSSRARQWERIHEQAAKQGREED